MIYCYNKAAVGDVLLVVVASSEGQTVAVEKRENIARVYRTDTQKTVGWNIFNASTCVNNLTGNGQLLLLDSQLSELNQLIHTVGFKEELLPPPSPQFVVGVVKECQPHPDSDHLSITQTEVDQGEVLQIVCGAANIEAGQRVVVAKPGTMMPNGLMIWPGSLRGVASNGMICSARELGLTQKAPGILVLPDTTEVGTAFGL